MTGDRREVRVQVAGDGARLRWARCDRLVVVEPPVLSIEGFRPGVTIPGGDWRAWTPRASASSPPAGAALHVVDLGAATLRRARRAIAAAAAPDQTYPQMQRAVASACAALGPELAAAAGRALGARVDVRDPIVALGYAHLVPERSDAVASSSTPDERSAPGVRGLHVDNWEEPRRPAGQRGRAAYKLLYNVGTGPRALAFDLRPFDALPELRALRAHDPRYFDWAAALPTTSPLVELYLARSPGPRLRRVVYPPGVAVVAPVQNLVHDGYPKDLEHADFCLQARLSFTTKEITHEP